MSGLFQPICQAWSSQRPLGHLSSLALLHGGKEPPELQMAYYVLVSPAVAIPSQAFPSSEFIKSLWDLKFGKLIFPLVKVN